MQDQMSTTTTALRVLTENIEAPETKVYLRGTLETALVNLGHEPNDVKEALATMFSPRTVQ